MNHKISQIETAVPDCASTNPTVAGSGVKAPYEVPQLTIQGRLRDLTLQPGASGQPVDTGGV